MRNELKEFERLLNQDWWMQEEGYQFKVTEEKVTGEECEDKFILFQIADENGIIVNNYRTEKVFDTLEENIMSLIKDIYNSDINYRNKLIKNWKTFSARKVGSLSKALAKGNNKRIAEINAELVKKLKLVEEYKKEVFYYKMFVSLLYRVKEQIAVKVA